MRMLFGSPSSTSHFMDASEISKPAARGRSARGMGNHRASVSETACVLFPEKKGAGEDPIRQLYHRAASVRMI